MLPFITAYDPLGGSTGSIDPPGAMQTYGSLADLLLPGVTTITTRSAVLMRGTLVGFFWGGVM